MLKPKLRLFPRLRKDFLAANVARSITRKAHCPIWFRHSSTRRSVKKIPSFKWCRTSPGTFFTLVPKKDRLISTIWAPTDEAWVVWPPSTSVELSSQLPPLPERWIDPVLSRIAPIESTNLHLVAITASGCTLAHWTVILSTPSTRLVTL